MEPPKDRRVVLEGIDVTNTAGRKRLGEIGHKARCRAENLLDILDDKTRGAVSVYLP